MNEFDMTPIQGAIKASILEQAYQEKNRLIEQAEVSRSSLEPEAYSEKVLAEKSLTALSAFLNAGETADYASVQVLWNMYQDYVTNRLMHEFEADRSRRAKGYT